MVPKWDTSPPVPEPRPGLVEVDLFFVFCFGWRLRTCVKMIRERVPQPCRCSFSFGKGQVWYPDLARFSVNLWLRDMASKKGGAMKLLLEEF